MRTLILSALFLLPVAAAAQTPPSAAHILGYDGLHLAAHQGDVAAIQRLAAEGAQLAAIIHEAPVLARGAMFEGPLLLDAHR